MLTEKQQRFLAKRRPFVRTWPVVGTLIIVCVLAMTGYLFWKSPRLINPYAALQLVQEKHFPTEHMVPTVLLPCVMVMFVLMFLVFIAFLFVSFGNEKKYLDIIDQLQQPSKDADT
ncbi:MAG: hypothetical protein ACFCD0_20700 [Gemmataceae bacterium]